MRDIDEIKKVVKYFNNYETTVRDTAKHCDISKSTVYTYLTKVIPTTEALKKLEKIFRKTVLTNYISKKIH